MVGQIKVLALDIDGVLTDGGAWFAGEGNELKRISFRDLDALTQAQNAGLHLVLVTGEDTPQTRPLAERFGISDLVCGAKDKAAALQEVAKRLGVSLAEICYVGDGDRDEPALSLAGLGLAPANASPRARSAAHVVLSQLGGHGAVAEAVGLLLNHRGTMDIAANWESQFRSIVEDSVSAKQRLLAESLPTLVKITQALIQAIQTGNKILLFGNGGSAADAQHVAAELVGRFKRERAPWAALALTTDTSILTAIANDWSFEEVFARQVRGLARPRDVVVGISTSGRSPNVLRGMEAGSDCGAVVIGFTGSNGDAMSKLADICFCAPAENTSRIQELHLLAWHAICEIVENTLSE